MSARPGLRQAMAPLHTWCGLLAGWLLYAMFLTGGVSYFRDDISQWMRPEIPAVAQLPPAPAVAAAAVRMLSAHAASSPRWEIWLPGPRGNTTTVRWQQQGRDEEALLAPAKGQVQHPRETTGGDFFYYLHFSLHYMPRVVGRWLAGAVAMASLVAILTGVVVHRRIFADFFTFRRSRGQRSWLDAHNTLSVLALPFHLMIVFTGLVTLMTLYMPWGAEAAFGPGHGLQGLRQGLVAVAPAVRGLGVPADMVPLDSLVQQAEKRWGAGEVERIIVQQPGNAGSQVTLVRGDARRLSVRPQTLRFAATDGQLLAVHEEAGPALRTWGVLYALHLGRFADSLTRWLYLLSSLAGAGMVATGLILWTVKRRTQPHAGGPPARTWMERANAAAMAGLSVAMAGFMLANRVLPTRMPDRAAWEIHGFFLAWALAAGYAFACRRTSAWPGLMVSAAVLLALVGMWDIYGLALGHLSFNLSLLAFGATHLLIALKTSAQAGGLRRR